MAISSEKLQYPNNSRLGDLLITWRIITPAALKEAIDIAGQTKMPIGRVIVMSGFVTDAILKLAVELQTLIRSNKITIELAGQALKMANQTGISLSDALTKCGWQDTDLAAQKRSIKLGDILVDSRLVTPDQLEAALVQANNTGLPFGRMLVLCGVLTDGLLACALNAQILLRDDKITKEQAIEALLAVKSRQASIEDVLVEKGFYQLPKRQTLRLGELLVQAKLITESELLNSIEIGLINRKPIGEVLINNGYLANDEILNASLELQKMVANSQLTNLEAVGCLTLIVSQKLPLDQALTKLNKKEANHKLNLNYFLQFVGQIKNDDLLKATHECLQDNEVFQIIMEKTNIISNTALKAAQDCVMLVEDKMLTLEHACIVYDYSRKKNLSIDQCLIELEWYQPGASTSIATELQTDESSYEDKLTLWSKLKAKAEQALRDGNYAVSEQESFKCLHLAEQCENNDSRIALSLDFVAEVLCRQGKFVLAEPLFRRSLVIKQTNLGQEHVIVASAISNLAKLFYFQKQYHEAESLTLAALKIYETVLGQEHCDVACALHNLATLYHVQHKWDEAELSYKRALSICRKTLGSEHPATIRLLKGYANLLKSTDRHSEADGMHRNSSGYISGTWKAITLPPDQMLNWDNESK